MASANAGDERTRTLLRDRIRRVFMELPGALAGEEEAVHQVRVAGRRLRVALPLLAAEGRARRLDRALRVLRRLTRTVGVGRDMDVLVALFRDRLAELKAPSAEQRALLSRLRAARARARGHVTETVQVLRIGRLRRDLRRLAGRGVADTAAVVARVRALREVEGAALLRGFSQVGDRYAPQALHALRRRARRLRYAAEAEDAVRGEDSRAPALWKRLQDGIGVLHDSHVLAAWFEEQARAAEARQDGLLFGAARRERRFFVAQSRRLHATLLEMKPADLALRALLAMARGRPIT
jgi:CHAD domain-containing protein